MDTTSTNITELGGTLEYMAPELFRRDAASQADLKAADIWAVGTMAFHLLTKSLGFRDRRLLGYGSPESRLFPQDCQISHDGKAFILESTKLEAIDRPGVDQLLAHAWVVAPNATTLSKHVATEGE